MPRFYIGREEGAKEIWRASNVALEANRVVTVDFGSVSEGGPERFKAALVKLARNASAARSVSSNTWIFELDSKLNEDFQILVDHLGVEDHSYTIVDLRSGEGLSYDAKNRVVCEYYAKNFLS